MRYWNRPAGIGELLRIALPLMVSTGCLTLTLFADRTLLLWYGQPEMAASMAGGNLFWSLICFPVGTVSMTSAFVAQYIGIGQHHRVGRLMWQAIWMSLAVLPLSLGWMPWTESLFKLMGQTSELIPLETVYLQVLMIGASGAVLESALAGFFSGIERTSVVMWVNIAAALLNLALDVVLIFGFAGFSPLGILGAGIASTVSFWFKAIVYFLLMVRWERHNDFDFVGQCCFDGPIFRRLLFFGMPAGMQYLIEAGSFAVIVLQIGQVGTSALTATAMAINFNMAAFVPLMGVSIAASVSVGKYLSTSNPVLARRAVVSAMTIGVTYASIWSMCYLSVPDFLLGLYQVGSSSQMVHATTQTARILLRFVAFYCILDAAQLVVAGALRGAGDTWYVLGASVTVAVVWISVGLLGKSMSSDLLYWWWAILACWITSMAIAMIARFMRGRWLTKLLVQRESVPIIGN